MLRQRNKKHIFESLISKHGGIVKPVSNGLSKIDKTKVLKTDGSFMKVESIADIY